MPAPARIEVETHSPNVAIVTLRGEHDLDSKPHITRALESASRHPYVLVDLAECTFIDSSVISALLQATNTLHKRGGLVLLVIPSGGHRAVRNVFELMSLQRLLPIHETRSAAIDYVETAPHATTGAGMRLRALSQIIDESLVEIDERRRVG